MFKELKVIKLLVLVGLLFAILFRIDFLNLTVYQLFTDKLSYTVGESVKIYASSKAKYPVFAKAPITDLQGRILDEVELNLKQSALKFDEVLRQGEMEEGYVEVRLDKKYKNGIYTIANKYPIVIGGFSAEVTVVYPHMNNLIYQKIEEENSMSLGLVSTSLRRAAEIDKFTRGLNPTFSYLDENYNTNYITDIELEHFDKIASSKLLIIYGKSTFWTPKMKTNLKQFMEKGGNVLLISSYALNNVCWYDEKNESIQLYDENSAEAIESYLGYNGDAPRFVINSSYLFGGTTGVPTYDIVEPNHPILKGIDDLSVHSKLYNSPPVSWNEGKPKVMLMDTNFCNANILAFNTLIKPSGGKGIKCIFEFQIKDGKGTIVNLGTEDWCLKKDQTLIKNSITYLLESTR